MKSVTALAVLLFAVLATSQPAGDKITSLPMWNQPLGNMYSGYIDVAPGTGRFLHYWFVESTSATPKTDPVVLWLNGGPGCSSLDGFFYEHGPIHFSPISSSSFNLVSNPYAWTSVANVIYLESPAGVGFSYSNNPNDYITNDNKTADDSYVFLQKWFALYPQYIGNDFWITGESYAGVYVPTLAIRVLAGNLNGQFKPKLKGVMVGNGVANSQSVGDLNGYISFIAGHGFISMNQFNIVNSTCTADPDGDQCQNLLQNAYGSLGGVDMYDVYADCFHQRPTDSQLRKKFGPNNKNDINNIDTNNIVNNMINKKKKRAGEEVPCIDSTYGEDYLNMPAVKAAIHVNASISWSICNGFINQNYDRTPNSMIPIYKQLLLNTRRVLIYSGDTDFAVPFTDSQVWTTTDMGFTPIEEWVQWYNDDDEGQQVAGFKNAYSNGFTFATVKGSGHMVPQFRPAAAFAMFKRTLNDQPL